MPHSIATRNITASGVNFTLLEQGDGRWCYACMDCLTAPGVLRRFWQVWRRPGSMRSRPSCAFMRRPRCHRMAAPKPRCWGTMSLR
jgi:hypothetical protein